MTEKAVGSTLPDRVENPFLKLLDLTREELAPAKEIFLAESARGDDVQAVCDFCELVFGLTPAAHHVAWLTEILENKRVVVVAPPESAKTTIISIVLLSWWIGKYPWTTNLIVSAGEDLASKIAHTVADTIEKNPKYRMVFPKVVPAPSGGMWSRDGYDVVDEGLLASGEWLKRTAAKQTPTLSNGGVGSASVNGKRVTGLLIGDDLHDRESKRSDSVCLNTVSFVTDTFIPRATENAHIIIIQTRWSPKDVVGYMEGRPGFKTFVHPAVTNLSVAPLASRVAGLEGQVSGLEDDPWQGESYWPQQWPLSRLKERRDIIGEIDFQLVYLCDPKAAQGRTLKRDWLHHYPYNLIKIDYERFLGVDFAQRIQEVTGGKTGDPDEFALAVLVNTNPVLVVENGFADTVTMGEAEEVFFQWAAMTNPVRSAIEVNKDGINYYTNLLKRMNSRRGQRYVLLNITTTRNKLTRMKEMAPYFQFGNMKISDEGTPFLLKFINQWVGFGSKSVKDDCLDAVYHAWKITQHLIPLDGESDRQRSERDFTNRYRERNPMKIIDQVYS